MVVHVVYQLMAMFFCADDDNDDDGGDDVVEVYCMPHYLTSPSTCSISSLAFVSLIITNTIGQFIDIIRVSGNTSYIVLL